MNFSLKNTAIAFALTSLYFSTHSYAALLETDETVKQVHAIQHASQTEEYRKIYSDMTQLSDDEISDQYNAISDALYEYSKPSENRGIFARYFEDDRIKEEQKAIALKKAQDDLYNMAIVGFMASRYNPETSINYHLKAAQRLFVSSVLIGKYGFKKNKAIAHTFQKSFDVSYR